MTDHEQMVISALRYALPRMSYIMSVTEEYIDNMLKGNISENFIRVCIESIEGYYTEKKRFGIIDPLEHNWEPLLKRLKG